MAKILQICTSQSWGGMEMYVSFLAKHLANRGHEIIPLCYPGSPLYHDFIEIGFRPYSLKLRGYFHLFEIVRLSNFLSKWQGDIIHSHYSKDLWTIVPALSLHRSLSKKRLIFTKHIGTQKSKHDFLHSWLYRRVDYLIAISRVIKENLLATHPVIDEKVGIIHHGIDLNHFSYKKVDRKSVRDALGFTKDQIIFGIIGRLQIGKGYIEFLEMARQIHKKYKNTRFLIVGEATKGEPQDAELIIKKISVLNLLSIIKCVGFRKDIPGLLAAMDIFVFPSHAEAFGLVVIEAMAMGKPVIATNSDGILDIIENDKTGILVSPKDISSLTQAGLMLAKDVNLRIRLGKVGQEHVIQAFSLDKMLDKIETCYHIN